MERNVGYVFCLLLHFKQLTGYRKTWHGKYSFGDHPKRRTFSFPTISNNNMEDSKN